MDTVRAEMSRESSLEVCYTTPPESPSEYRQRVIEPPSIEKEREREKAGGGGEKKHSNHSKESSVTFFENGRVKGRSHSEDMDTQRLFEQIVSERAKRKDTNATATTGLSGGSGHSERLEKLALPAPRVKPSSSSPHLNQIGKQFLFPGTAKVAPLPASLAVPPFRANKPLFHTNQIEHARKSSSALAAGLTNSITSLNELGRATAAGRDPFSQTPPMHTQPSPGQITKQHRGELDVAEKYNYDLSKAQLKASSRTSALLAGFAMVALVELQYDETTPRALLIVLGVVTTLLVSVHLLALMMSTCILPYMEATGCTQDSPHIRLKLKCVKCACCMFYIDLSWLFSTCIGLVLFLIEIGVIFFVKFNAVGYDLAAYITTAMLVPVLIVFVVFSYLIHKSRVAHSLGRFQDKVDTMKQFLDTETGLSKIGAIKQV